MSSPAAVQAKSDGTTAWSAGSYSLAAEHFTTAINLGGDKEFLKVLYSNRSAAYLKLNKITEALKDGNKCVELDSSWAKGYVRKGDALLASKQFTEAYNAYNSAARISPSDNTVKEKCEQAMRGIRNAADASGASGASQSAPNTSGSANVHIYVQYAQITVLVLFFLQLVPFFSMSYRTISHKLCVGIFGAVAAYHIYVKYGFPKFTSEWAQRIVPDPLTMDLFLSLVLIMNKPYVFAMAPVVLKALCTFTQPLLKYVRTQYPAVQASIQPLLAKYMPSMANVNLAQALAPSTGPEIDRMMMRLAATAEAYHGIYLIFELVLPSRNIMQLYIWWQYLRMRYMVDTSGNLKIAFSGIDQRISGLLAMRMCPEAVRQGYSMLKTYLAKQVAPPTADAPSSGAGGAGGLAGMMSKCTIM